MRKNIDTNKIPEMNTDTNLNFENWIQELLLVIFVGSSIECRLEWKMPTNNKMPIVHIIHPRPLQTMLESKEML